MVFRSCALSLILAFMSAALTAEASSIKVLILDDVFQSIPGREEAIEPMGKLKGDLLVNGTHYMGNIEVWKGQTSLYLINELPIEDYVKNVVKSEVGTNWDMEALKVQAVIARTYALYQKTVNKYQNFDLTSSVLHQVYKGSSTDSRISYAVMNTEGEVLTYDGKLIETFYHSTSGGMTEAPEEVFGKKLPYLRPVETSCETSPFWVWERRVPTIEIEKGLNLRGITEIRLRDYTVTQRVKTVEVVHESGTATVKATDLRKALGWSRLPSTNFTVAKENGSYVFDGKGYGHGVGLCQWSSLEMARKGMNYKEILAYFYPGTTIRIYEGR